MSELCGATQGYRRGCILGSIRLAGFGASCVEFRSQDSTGKAIGIWAEFAGSGAIIVRPRHVWMLFAYSAFVAHAGFHDQPFSSIAAFQASEVARISSADRTTEDI